MSSTPILRTIDASLNRATEGLRVVEDYVRFVLDDRFLTDQVKQLRHQLAEAAAILPTADRHTARDTRADVGTEVTTPSEAAREDAWGVCAANLKRSQQSLRSLEEFGKLIDGGFAARCEAIRYRLYTLEKAIDTSRRSRDRLEGVRLCVLVDGGATADDFERLVATLVAAGVGMIQLRDNQFADRALLARARLLRRLTDGRDTLAVVNDRPDVAAAADADILHLGQDDLPLKEARTIVGPRMLIGISTHNLDQACAAVLDGADYLGAGPTFPSPTKAFDRFAGVEYLRQVSAEIQLPIFAIGGITASNLSEVLASGISRVAVGSAVTAAADPAAAARTLGELLASPDPDKPRA